MQLTPPNRRVYRPRKGFPFFLPQAVVEKGEHTTAFSRGERRAMRKKQFKKPSEWAPHNRKIVKGDLAGNFMNMEVTPHLRGIMDAAVLPFIREIGIIAAPQTAKTTGIDTIIAWTRVFAKGPACSFYPDETTGKRSMKTRIRPMVEQSPALRREVVAGKDSYTQTGIDFIGGEWEVGWVGSIAQTADRSLKYCDMQEVDKPAYGVSKDETSPLYLLRKRVRSYGDTGKVFITSSPTTVEGNINQYIEHECEAVFVQWVKCPYCHEEIIMLFSEETFWWPKDADGHSIDRRTIGSKKLARYICQNCDEKWDDSARDKAIRRETWRLRIVDDEGELTDKKGEEMFRYLYRHRPAAIGFIMPSWYSYFVSLSEVAQDFLRSVDPNLSPEERFKSLKDFRNGHEARPWKVETVTHKIDKLKSFCDDRPQNVLPGGEVVASLLGSIDTQDNGEFYLSLWAFGWGFANEQWLVRRERIFSFADISRILWESEYYDADGQRYVVEHAVIDMLGHRTKEVLEFCMQYDGLITPYFGSAHKMTQPFTWSNREYLPGSDKPIPGGGIRALRINSKYYKDNLYVKMSLDPDTPGCVHFFRYEELGDDFLQQLLSESRNEKDEWSQISSRPNHYWDNWYSVNCLADWLGVKTRIKPEISIANKEVATEVVVDLN